MKRATGLKSHIGFWMRLISNTVSHAFARRLEGAGVGVAEWVVLREMYGKSDKTSPGQVADVTGLSKGAVSKIVHRLLEKKLVVRESSGEDRRYQDIHLTRKGKALVPRLAELADLNDKEFFGELTSKERHDLVKALQKLAKINNLNTFPIS
jgi:DNA-binding MarR family transcriptional regulator